MDQVLVEIDRVVANGFGKLVELNHVNAPLATLDIRNNRLIIAHPLGDDSLVQTRLLTSFGEGLRKDFTLTRID